VAFPLLEEQAGKPGLMDGNKEQHKALSEGIEAFKAYVSEVAQNKTLYNGAKMVQLLNNFGSALVDHLNDEIPTILALEKHPINWHSYNKIVTKHAVNNADKVNMRRTSGYSTSSGLIFTGQRSPLYHDT
jgi:hypothetical protein